jgi:hypothetical protein
MSKLDNFIEKSYKEVTENACKIKDIFNEFFGENRVDADDIISLDEYREWLKTLHVEEVCTLPLPAELTNFRKHTLEYVELTSVDMDLLITKINMPYIINILNTFNITVHFPKVRVTNENGKYEDIYDLYALVRIHYQGTISGYFKLNKATYTVAQFKNKYVHSHVPSLNYDSLTFQTPCLGSGPIKDTITSLSVSFDEDLWSLFCVELSKYVCVESLYGGPYKRLESIGSNDGYARNMNIILHRTGYSSEIHALLTDFVKHLLKSNVLKYSYTKGAYSLGMPIVDYVLIVSNAFIEWYNRLENRPYSLSTLIQQAILYRAVTDGNNIYRFQENIASVDIDSYIGQPVCMFKGKSVTLNIIGRENEECNICYLLTENVTNYIITNILKIINYRYGREQENSGIDKKTLIF